MRQLTPISRAEVRAIMRFMQSRAMVALAFSGAALAAPRLAAEKFVDLPAARKAFRR
ncbi:MAG TPA: hypothetical protein PLT94_08920 [Rhodocyclaceae bacterium]|nr:hypothetical protein [Rhodocyclaceae bacterium]